ncbi:MAG: tetratricopeptide repeat protein, partial [Pyrinomonadaceae bacterium]
MQRNISQGEKHFYQIPLQPNQYLRLLLSVENADLTVAVYNSAARKSAFIQTRRHGPTPLSLISDTAGTYLFELQSLSKSAQAAHYEIEVEEMRDAAAQDLESISAERAMSEGDQLYAQWKEQSFQEALKKYEAAETYWRAAGNRIEEANALRNVGDIFYSTGKYAQASQSYEHALAIFQAAEDHAQELEMLNELAHLRTIAGKYDEAQKLMAQAGSLSQQLNDRRGMAQTLHHRGEVAYYLSEMDKAVDLYRQALSLWQTLGDLSGQAQTLTDLGYAYTDLSDVQKALEYYQEALELWRATGNRRGEGLTLTAIGLVHSLLDEHQQALDFHKDALKILQAIGDRDSESIALNGLGYEYRNLGDYGNALSIYEQTTQRLEEAQEDPVGLCAAQVATGDLYRFMAEYEKALNYYNQALGIGSKLGDPRLQEITLRNIGAVYDARGEKDQALEYYKKALPLSRAAGDLRGEAETLNLIGYVQETRGNKSLALDLYAQALQMRRTSEDHTGEALTLYSIARIKRDMGRTADAEAQIETAIKIIESLRTKINNENLRASYFASVHELYDLKIDLLMRLHAERPSEGFDITAFETSERARARSLLETLAMAHTDIHQGVEPALLQRERSLQLLLDATAQRQSQMLTGKHTDEQAKQLARTLRELTNEYEDVEQQIRAQSPRYVALTQPQPLTVSEIQQQTLDADTLLLEYSLGDAKSYVWAVTPTGLKSFELPARKEIEQAAERFYDLLTARRDQPGETLQQKQERVRKAEAQFPEAAAALSEMLLGRVASLLGTKRLLIVSDGALQHVPFAALPVPQSPESGVVSLESKDKNLRP